MGAAALTARLPALRARSRAAALPLGLAFDQPGGPLVAVSGTAGGAGASTLALLLATQAARESRAPVLACDTGGPSAGLSLHAGIESRRTLCELADSLDAGGRVDGQIFAAGPEGLRLVAGTPRFRPGGTPEGVERVLRQAKAAHGLSVADCGTLQREADQVAFELATHRAWVLTASSTAALAAEKTLAQVRQGGVREAIVARNDRGARAPMRDLRRLARNRGAPLILLPNLLARHPPGSREAAEVSQGALAALAGWLR